MVGLTAGCPSYGPSIVMGRFHWDPSIVVWAALIFKISEFPMAGCYNLTQHPFLLVLDKQLLLIKHSELYLTTIYDFQLH